jgi:hypothetical protein
MKSLLSCSYINQSSLNNVSILFMKTTKAMVVSNLISNKCFCIIDEKHDDYTLMSML